MLFQISYFPKIYDKVLKIAYLNKIATILFKYAIFRLNKMVAIFTLCFQIA